MCYMHMYYSTDPGMVINFIRSCIFSLSYNNQRASEASELSHCSCQLRFEIYMAGWSYVKSSMRMLNKSLLGNEFKYRKK